MKNTFILVILLWVETLVAGTSLLAASRHTAVDEKPFIFNFTESAAPGETVGLQGSSFGASPEIWYTVLKGKNPSVKPQTKLNIPGIVYEATATTITDRKQEWQDFTDRISTAWQYAVHPTNYMIAIVSGKGAGQWRTIVHNNDTVLSLDRPWDVIPEKGSHYLINQWSAYQLLVKGNILKDNYQGIMMYCGGADIDIVDNELINSSGIYLRADQRLSKKRYNLLWNTYVADNICADEDGRRAAFVSLLLSVEKDQELFGVGALGLTVRRNTVKAFMPNVTHSPVKAEGFLNYLGDQAADNLRIHPESPGILGTVFEDNTAINTDNAFILGKGAHHTVILNNKTERIANPVKNKLGEKQEAGARYTITDIQ